MTMLDDDNKGARLAHSGPSPSTPAMHALRPSAVSFLILLGCIPFIPAALAYVALGDVQPRGGGGIARGPSTTLSRTMKYYNTPCRRATIFSVFGSNRGEEAVEIPLLDRSSVVVDPSLTTPSSNRRRDLLFQKLPSAALSVAAATATTIAFASAAPTASRAAELSANNAAAETAVLTAAEAGVTTTMSTASTTAAAPLLRLPPMGLGAWAWGDSLFWGYDKKNDDELQKVFDYAVDAFGARNEPTLLDTAEIYGFGRSESLVGQFSAKYPSDKVVVATKYAALPFRSSAKDVVKACKASLKRLDRESIDLYQIHFPNAWSNAEYWDGLADCVDQGLVKAVGVSNYGVDAVQACHRALQKRGIPLATNQIQFSLLYRYPIDNGLLQCCQDLGVQVLSYSPLALGMLTGKYTKESPPAGPRKALYEKLASSTDYDNLLAIMKDVAAVRPGATLSQVALNWARAKGTIPIPGARTMSQIQQNLQALSWSLSPEEERALDVAASKVTSFITPADAFFVKEDRNTGLKMFDS